MLTVASFLAAAVLAGPLPGLAFTATPDKTVDAAEKKGGPYTAEGIDLGPIFDNPWWPQWLQHADRNGNLVEDEIESRAHQAVATHPGALVPLLITFGRPLEDDDASRVRQVLDATVVHEFRWIPTILARVPVHLVAEAGRLPGVVAVEWDRPLTPLLTASAAATQSREASGSPYNGQTAESLGYKGDGMVIAVLDTGVADKDPVFAGKWIAGAETTMMGSFYGATNPDIGPLACMNPEDDESHGTHVAATALGNAPGSNHKGTAMDARLVEIKIAVAGASGVSGTIVQPFAIGGGDELAFEWILDWNQAIDNGSPLCGASTQDRIDVATLSFGTQGAGGPNAGSSEAIITQMTVNGVVVTIAAGNVGGSEFTISAPGNAAGAISVANSDDKNTIDRTGDSLASSSSRGPVQGTATSLSNLVDRNRKPELAAPGTGIEAAHSKWSQTPAPANAIWLRNIGKSGTSMATPHVAGIAALLIEAGEDVKGQTGGVNLMRPKGPGFDAANKYVPGQHPVRDALIHSAHYMTSGVSAPMLTKWQGPGAGGLTWNNGYGYGHVNAFAALCWAWTNVLKPGGATPSETISTKCQLAPPPLVVDAGGPYLGGVGTSIPIAGAVAGGSAPVALRWSVVSQPAGAAATFTDDQSASTTFSADTVGNYVISLTATDAQSVTNADEAEVTIAEEAVGSRVEIHAPTEGASLPQGVVDVSGLLVRVGPAPAGSLQQHRLWLVGDGRAVSATDLLDGTVWPLSPTGHGNDQTYYDVIGGWNVQANENRWLPTFRTTSLITFDGSPVRLNVYVDEGDPARKVGPNCGETAQLFDGSGALIGPAAPAMAPAGLGFGIGDFHELVFQLTPPAGTYNGLKVQFGTPNICPGPTTFSWGSDAVPARLEWTTGAAGPAQAGAGNVTLHVAGEETPRATVAVTVPDNATVPFSISADLSDLQGEQVLQARWLENDGTTTASSSVRVLFTAPPPPAIQITAPDDGAQVGPDFRITGTTSGTGTRASTAASGVSAVGGLSQASRTGLGLAWHPALVDVEREMSRLPGFLALVPVQEGPTSTLHAYFGGRAPAAAHNVKLPAAWLLEVHERVEPQPLRSTIQLPDGAVSGTQNHDPVPPIAPWNQYISPGAQLFTFFDGNFNSASICTANFIWKDQNGDVYIGAAGHCFLPGDVTNADGSFDLRRVTVDICRSECVVGGFTGAQAMFAGLVLDVVRLGSPTYARQEGVGHDFGLVKIPADLLEDVDPAMPGWSGPTGVLSHDNFNGDLVLLHGNGLGTGEVTKNRLGVSLADGDTKSWVAIMTGMPGDSGSAIQILSPWDQAANVASPLNAAGLLTHGSVSPVVGLPLPAINWGTTMPRAQAMALEAGLCVVPVLQGQDAATAPAPAPTPACPTKQLGVPATIVGLQATPMDQAVRLEWAPPADGGAPIQGYTVEYGTQSGGPYPQQLNTSDNATTVGGLQNGVTYYFRVHATNANGNGAPSAEASATPDDDVVTYGVQVRILAAEGVLLDWTDAESYDSTTGAWHHDVTDLAAGDYTIEARLLGDGEPLSSDAVQVTVAEPNEAPTARIQGPTESKKGKHIDFSGQASSDPEGSGLTYHWDLGDGTTATTVDVQHRYKTEGTYTITLTVRDAEGATGTATHKIRIAKN